MAKRGLSALFFSLFLQSSGRYFYKKLKKTKPNDVIDRLIDKRKLRRWLGCLA
jgi:hypothetical protein